MFASGSPMRIRRGTVADRARFAVRHGQRPARFGERGGARRTRRPRGGASEPDSGTAATERRQIPLRPHSAGPEHDEVRMHQEVRRTGSNGRSPAARRPLLPVRRRGGRAAHRRRRKGSNAARGAPTPVRAVGHHPRPQKSASEPSRWRTAMGLRVLRRATGDHAGRTALGRDARRCRPGRLDPRADPTRCSSAFALGEPTLAWCSWPRRGSVWGTPPSLALPWCNANLWWPCSPGCPCRSSRRPRRSGDPDRSDVSHPRAPLRGGHLVRLPACRLRPLSRHLPVVGTAVLRRRADLPSPQVQHFLRLALATPEPDMLDPKHTRTSDRSGERKTDRDEHPAP